MEVKTEIELNFFRSNKLLHFGQYLSFDYECLSFQIQKKGSEYEASSKDLREINQHLAIV